MIEIKDIDLAINILKEKKYSCVIVRKGKVLFESKRRGIFPLYQVNELLKIDIKDAALADRVIGTAAAMIAVEAGVIQVYGKVISEGAIKKLDSNKIKYDYETKTKYIKNRELTGMCPIETIALETKNYSELIQKIKEFLIKLEII